MEATPERSRPSGRRAVEPLSAGERSPAERSRPSAHAQLLYSAAASHHSRLQPVTFTTSSDDQRRPINSYHASRPSREPALSGRRRWRATSRDEPLPHSEGSGGSGGAEAREVSRSREAAVVGVDLSQLPCEQMSPTQEDPEVEDGDEDPPLANDQDRDRDRAPSPVESERLTILCTCEEFDVVRLPEILSSRMARPCRWRYGQQIISAPFSKALLQQQPQAIRAKSDRKSPSKEPSTSSWTPGQARILVAPAQFPGFLEPLLQKGADEASSGSLFFFRYGVVVMWGLTPEDEQGVLRHIVEPAGLRPLSKEFAEKDMFYVEFRATEMTTIRNDRLFLPRRLRGHLGCKLSIAHAVAQSTKLSVFEEQGLALLEDTKHLPRELAATGRFSLTRTALSKLIGRLFVHKSEVNLLSTVLDAPEYFWSAPDSLAEVFRMVGTYLEIEERTEAVKTRLDVVQEMFDMLQSRHDAQHGTHLEWIVIILVALEFFVGILEFCGTIGFIGPVGGGVEPLAVRIHKAFFGDKED